MKRILLIGLVVLAACGKSKSDGDKGGGGGAAPGGNDDCAAASAHMTELQAADLPKEMPAEQQTKIKALMAKVTPVIAQSCRDTKWSKEALTCMTALKSISEAKTCEDKLTKEQQTAVETAATKAAEEAQKPSPEETAAALKAIAALKDEMCACKDAACGEAVYAKWGDVEHASEGARHDEATKTAWEATDDELMKCKNALK